MWWKLDYNYDNKLFFFGSSRNRENKKKKGDNIIVVFVNRIKYMRIRVSYYDKKVLDFRNKEEGIK